MFGNWLLVPRMLHLRYPHYTPVIKSQKNWEQLERTLKIEKKIKTEYSWKRITYLWGKMTGKNWEIYNNPIN